jgi:NADH-quinone oxidoreductase subunit G
MSDAKPVRLTIDGLKMEVAAGTNILKAAERAGIAIPHFCYHPGLEVEGNCRMCLVEIEGLPKLELACSTGVREGMVVKTSSERVRQARKDVLEFLLAEHPLDCPICDKAGECRLQDYADRHGSNPPRMAEPRLRREKRLPIGRRLLLDRERCVMCTRCVRFLRQVTRTGELGVFERNLRSEIGIYDNVSVDNDYSGNLVDICPVGAITSTDFRFKTRAWFLSKKPSICPHCGRGCAIFVESVTGYPLAPKARRIYRITARENPAVNGFWICDLGRDGRRELDEGRLAGVLRKGAGADEAWPRALAEVGEAIRAVPGPDRADRISIVLNARMTCEELARARDLFVRDLGLKKVFFAARRAGDADGLLRTAERVPNARGVREAGFAPRPPVLSELAAASVLLVFGGDLFELVPPEDLDRALAAVSSRFLFTSHAGPLDGRFDIVFPAALPAEKAGSYINVDGIRQTFERALRPQPGVATEGEILACLAHGLGLNLGDGDAC